MPGHHAHIDCRGPAIETGKDRLVVGYPPPTEPGALSVAGDGTVSFSAGAGTVRRLTVNPDKKNQCLAALVALATAKPAPPQGRGGG